MTVAIIIASLPPVACAAGAQEAHDLTGGGQCRCPACTTSRPCAQLLVRPRSAAMPAPINLRPAAPRRQRADDGSSRRALSAALAYDGADRAAEYEHQAETHRQGMRMKVANAQRLGTNTASCSSVFIWMR